MSTWSTRGLLSAVSTRTAIVALCAAVLAAFVAPSLANARVGSIAAAARPGCVLCDSCNGGSGNHITSNGGGREGSAHVCFTGSTCNVHDFNPECAVEEENKAAGSAKVSWQSLQNMNGAQLADLLSRTPNRWVVRADLGTIQVTDCYGNLVASLPISESQLSTAASVVADLGAN
jgi:hypothetical protein